MKPKAGDRIIITGKKTAEGILMPSSTHGVVVVKLDNGYNVGFKDVKVKVVEKGTEEKEKKEKRAVQQKELPHITILHTGGTIASQVDYETGAVIARFTPEDILHMFPEMKEVVHVDSRLLRNMWSGDMRFAHHNIMAKAVEQEVKKGVKGIIITHGTDTMGYSAAALAFILENVPIPIIFVGAQRSSDRGSSDAGLNLICAAQFIVNSDFKGVALCMHEQMSDEGCVILPACKTRKFHSSRRDAFQAINAKPLASITKDGSVTKLSEWRTDAGKFIVKHINERLKVGIVKFHPNMFAEELLHYKNFDGLVVEGTGLGNGPVDVIDKETKEHDKILKALTLLAKKMPVVMTTQTIFGRINMDVYSYGRKIQAAGVIGNHCDMLTETAFVKLAWLLSNHKNVKELMVKNLRGEIGERTVIEEDFLSG